jgi:hypothetical protein
MKFRIRIIFTKPFIFETKFRRTSSKFWSTKFRQTRNFAVRNFVNLVSSKAENQRWIERNISKQFLLVLYRYHIGPTWQFALQRFVRNVLKPHNLWTLKCLRQSSPCDIGARILGPFWREKIRGFCRKSAPPYFNVHEFTMLVGLWSYFPTNPRLSNWLWMRAWATST